MIQRIRRFSVLQTAKVVALLYALLGVIFMPFFVLASLFAPKEGGFGLAFALLFPVFYGVIGFIFAAVACALYNAVAGMVGGVEVELEA